MLPTSAWSVEKILSENYLEESIFNSVRGDTHRGDDFGVSDAILLGDANFGQTSIKCRDLACNVETSPLKIVRIRPWNWKPNSFSQLHLQAQMFIFFRSRKVWKWEKYYHKMLGCKRIHKPGAREDIFWIFKDFYGVMQVQSPTCTPTRKFHQWRR